MADKPLFTLDTEARWRLAYDRQQWIVQRRKTLPRQLEGTAIAEAGSDGVGAAQEGEPRCKPRPSLWKAVSFIGSEKRILRRVLREAGVFLTPEAQAQFDALLEQFLDFIPAPERIAEQPVAKAA